MKYILAVIIICAVILRSQCQAFSMQSSNESLNHGQRALTYLNVISSSFLVINGHEMGHSLMAKLAGDSGAKYRLLKKNENGGYSIGYTSYDYKKLSRTGNIAVPLAGALTSKVISIAANQALRNIAMSNVTQRFVSNVYLAAKFDIPFQVFQGLLKSSKFDVCVQYQCPTGTDMVDFGYYFSRANRKKFRWTNVTLITLSALDLYLSRQEIKRNAKVLVNDHYYDH